MYKETICIEKEKTKKYDMCSQEINFRTVYKEL